MQRETWSGLSPHVTPYGTQSNMVVASLVSSTITLSRKTANTSVMTAATACFVLLCVDLTRVTWFVVGWAAAGRV
ncbi:hypothetical protein LX36DRAFT_171798 [Colletotrichum falcatum]|nr:hypothetical protein LX36DRAFT_171798 [Colletotrichum falcatum]